MWHHSHDNEKQKKTYNRNNVANKHWKSKRPITNRCHAQGIYRLSVIQNLPFLCRPKHFTSCCQPKHITSLAQPKLRTSFCQLKHIASLSIRTNTEHTRGHFAISRNGSSSADVICNENVTPMTLHAFSSHHEESREDPKRTKHFNKNSHKILDSWRASRIKTTLPFQSHSQTPHFRFAPKHNTEHNHPHLNISRCVAQCTMRWNLSGNWNTSRAFARNFRQMPKHLPQLQNLQDDMGFQACHA